MVASRFVGFVLSSSRSARTESYHAVSCCPIPKVCPRLSEQFHHRSLQNPSVPHHNEDHGRAPSPCGHLGTDRRSDFSINSFIVAPSISCLSKTCRWNVFLTRQVMRFGGSMYFIYHNKPTGHCAITVMIIQMIYS